jgi:hypothetical protein
MINYQQLLVLFHKDYLASVAVSLWGISVLIGMYHATVRAAQYRKATVGCQHRIRYHLISVLVLSMGQWITMVTTMKHLGIEHGWIVHMVNEGQAGAFGFFAVANVLISRTCTCGYRR